MPLVAATAIGFTIASCRCRKGSLPSLVCACEMPELSATLMFAAGPASHWIPSNRQRNTSRYMARKVALAARSPSS